LIVPFAGREDRSRRPTALGFATVCVLAVMLGPGAVAPVCAAPDPSPGEAVELSPVVVVAEARDRFQSGEDAAGFSDVVYTENAWRGFKTVTELLQHAVGVQVTRFGGREDFATISVRGAGAGQVKILIDGVSLSRAQNRVVNLADLPMDSIERIEIYRGFTPARFAGSDAASLVNIITKKDKRSGYRLSASYGSFGTAKLGLQATGPSALGTVSGYLTYRRSDGDFPFADDGGTPQNPLDDVRRRRINNESESLDALLKLRADLGTRGTLNVSNNTFSKDEGVPGQGGAGSDRASLRSLRNIFNTAWQSRDGDLAASWDLTYLRETFRDPLCPVPTPPGCGTLGFGFERSDNRTLATTLNLHGEHELTPSHRLQTSMQLAFERFDGKIAAASTPQRRQQRATLSIAVGDQFTLGKKGLTLLPQLRHEIVWNDFEGSNLPFLSSGARLPSSRLGSTDPRLGLRWDAWPWLTFKTNGGSYFRPPDFAEVFGDTGFSKANPELKPERGVSADAGFQLHLGATNFEYAYFLNNVDDLIVFIQTGQRVAKAQNVAQARVHGHELRLETRLGEGLTVRANYTRQQTENLTPQPGVHGKELPALPADDAYIAVDWHTSDRAGNGWEWSYELEFRGRRFFDEANLLPTPSQTVHNLSLAWRPRGLDFKVVFEADNLTDEQVSDQLGFPVPGRSFFLSLSYVGGGNANDTF